ncbi:TerB family tellurite resistance protein [Paraconexibacter antarcticus]|uniref:TerB family tellurite resistance protein n=2 Tax=Paraconexibacter antarcticus TaxID=2949664 RepID=A0ABY5DQ63_9ACTN|nr:TerB family tellurite resistance protein [Paraconexibacter antarcticus]
MHLEASIENALALPAAGRRRLGAHLVWLLAERPGSAGLKARTKTLDLAERATLARFLLALAAADGHVSSHEVDAIKRLYTLLGLDAAAVHGDMHALASSAPIPVIPADHDAGDFTIPAQPAKTADGGAQSGGDLVLNPARLAEVMASTRQVSQVLTAVFIDEESAERARSPDIEEPLAGGVAGLDPAHSRFVRALAAQPAWPRAELEAVAVELGLMASGAIETVNDAAFDAADAPLLEGHDPVELDREVLKEILDD